MKCVVGIGNFGKSYEKTRHNVGFRVLDALSAGRARWKERKEFNAFVAELNPDCFLAKSKLFVNQTGSTVQALLNKEKVSASELLVVCDDVNLEFGKLRLRKSGSAGGHHGLESIIESLASDEFPRLRVGVGNETMPRDLESFVLETFNREEEEKIKDIIHNTAAICKTWAEQGFGPALDCLSKLQSNV